MKKLKGAFSPNPRLLPLSEGAIQIPGVEIQWQSGSPGEMFLLHLRENAFDIFEFSIATYMITCNKLSERERLRWTALPIFLSKALMWLKFFVHTDSGITTLADLRGKRVGIPDYHMTAALWMRIFLKELYGIGAEEIEWFNGRPQEKSHGKDVTAIPLKPGIVLTQAKQVSELDDKLERGEIDAAFGSAEFIPHSASVRSLFGPGEAARLVGEFRRKTGLIPTNHLVVVKQKLIDEKPELAMDLYRGFEMSKQEAYKRARRSAEGYLLFADDAFAEQAALFGDDPYLCGLAANREMLSTIARALVGEGLLDSMPVIDSLFSAATRLT